MALFIGTHGVDAGGIDMAVRRAVAAGADALQIFSAKPHFYNEKITVRPERVARFQGALRETGLGADRCMVHAAYVLNTASPEAEKYERACLGLARELERTEQLGVRGFCFHPGSALEGDLDSAIDRVGDAVTRALEARPGRARLWVENTAGAGRTVGRSAEEIARILARVPAAHRPRTGYGLDTCHLFASGLDFTSSAGAARGLLDRFCDLIGEAPSFMHMNDSDGEFGSNRDRHALIGEGRIGLDPFRWLLADTRLENIPLVAETPQARPEIADDDATADAYDARMVALLRQLAREARGE